MTHDWIAQETVQRLAGSLLHFLWQGVVIALIAACCLRLLKRRSAETRYAVSVAALVLMLAAPAITFLYYGQTGALTLKLLFWLDRIMDAQVREYPAAPAIASWTWWIVMLWAIGVTAFAARLLMGWHLSRSLIGASEAVPTAVLCVFEHIKERFVLRKPVRLLANARIDTPIVVGCFRPVVLLPLTALTGLNEDHLLAVLAHELAHIRRHDFFLNILQRCAESILFYHPAVWWLSRRIRDERENCCDDTAVQMCGNGKLYVKALLDLESKRSAVPGLAVAANGGSLVQRSRRILGFETPRCDWQTAATTLVFMSAWMIVGIWQSTALNAEPRVAAQPIPQALSALPIVQSLPSPIAGAIGAIAAIVTAQPVVAEPATVAAGIQGQAVGSIRGLVSRPGTTEGIADVEVTIRASDERANRGPFHLKTNAAGNFSLNEIPVGSWLVTAERDGYVPFGEGNLAQVAASVVAQTPTSVALQLIAAGVIRGRITDSFGDPVPGLNVRPVVPGYDATGRRTWLTNPASPAFVTTDDRGEYRVYSVRPGEYFVQVLGRPSPTTVTSTLGVLAYFPGSTDPALATPISVNAGVESTADIVLPQFIGRGLSGSIHLEGPVAARRTVNMYATPRDVRIPAYPMRLQTSFNENNTRFSFSDIPPGSYDIRVVAGPRTSIFTGRVTLDLTDDLDGIALTLHPVANLKIHVAGTGNVSSSAIANLSVSLVTMDAADGTRQNLQFPDSSGNLSVLDVFPGLHVFRFPQIPAGLYVSDIRQGPRSIAETGLNVGAEAPDPVEIVLASSAGSLQGTVELPASSGSAVVVLVPDGAQRRNMILYRSIRTDSAGRFSFSGIAPGRYKLFAWESNGQDADQFANAALNAEFLAQYEAQGLAVTVDPGATTTNSRPPLIRSLVFPPIPRTNLPARTTSTPALLPLPDTPTVRIIADTSLSVKTAGTIAGRLTGIDGKPLVGMTVIAGSTIPSDGQRNVNQKRSVTNDRGEYRIFGLDPGAYIVGTNALAPVMIRSVRDLFTRTYFPGTAELSKAVPVNVAAGARITDIDIAVQPAQSLRISGKVTDALASEATRRDAYPAEVHLIPQERSPIDNSSYSNPGIPLQADGTYAFTNVQSGTYYVVALGKSDIAAYVERPKAWTTVRVGQQDLTDVNLSPTRGVKVTGQVVGSNGAPVNGGAPRLIAGGAAMNQDGQQFLSQIAETGPNGTFTISNVSSGSYRFVSSRSNSEISDVRVGTSSMLGRGLSVGDSPIDGVVISIGGRGTLSGYVVRKDSTAGLGAVPGAAVVLQPDPQRRADGTLYRVATASASGQFSISDIPPGNYTVLAFLSYALDPVRNVQLLEEFASFSQTVTITSNSETKVTLAPVLRAVP